jgi:hypothetical protein
VARLLRFAALAGSFAALAVAAGCGGGSGTSAAGESIGLAQLSRAAATSADASSGRFAFSFEASMPDSDEAFAFAGEGAFDAASRRGSFSFDFSSIAKLLGKGFFGGIPVSGWPDFDEPGAWQLEAIQDGDVSYVRFPALDSQLPAGKSWVRADAASTVKAQGLDLTPFKQFDGEDRAEMLDYLRAAAGEIETVGTEELRGTSTTHYRATVDLEKYASLARPSERDDPDSFLGKALPTDGADIPVDVWLDGQGFVRKLEMTLTADEGTASMDFELWDYGQAVAIELPPADEVIDESALAR